MQQPHDIQDPPSIPARSTSLKESLGQPGVPLSLSESHRSQSQVVVTPEPLRQHDGVTCTLSEQREHLIEQVRARQSSGEPSRLGSAGRAIFEKAGFAARIDQPSDVEVITRHMNPVVQETIVKKIHTEYSTELTRDIHKYHEYPVVQPLRDPDPIILPTRHRFFSPIDKKWHEVVGDEAAIAILGEDVFRYGPKQNRESRRTLDAAGDRASPHANEPRIIERECDSVDTRDHTAWTILSGTDEPDHQVSKEGKLRDGLEGLGEGVRTLHITL